MDTHRKQHLCWYVHIHYTCDNMLPGATHTHTHTHTEGKVDLNRRLSRLYQKLTANQSHAHAYTRMHTDKQLLEG